MESSEIKGILQAGPLPNSDFDRLWDSISVESGLKDRLLAQSVLNFTLRSQLDREDVPLHGVILLVGPPGTGKTSLARGLASKTASVISGTGRFQYLEVEPHALASKMLGQSQHAVKHLLGTVIAEHAGNGPLVVVLDEVETLAADRAKLSLEANPVDVHRATDAVLAQLDHLAQQFPNLLFIATSNFPEALDEAFVSRCDLVATVGMPPLEICETIIRETLSALAQRFPKLQHLITKSLMEKVAREAHGLDGRRLRKTVLSAFTYDKRTAVDPNRLTAEELLQAFRDAKQSMKPGGKKWQQ